MEVEREQTGPVVCMYEGVLLVVGVWEFVVKENKERGGIGIGTGHISFVVLRFISLLFLFRVKYKV